MNDFERDDPLLQQAAALPAGIEPSRDLWPGIADRLGAQQRAPAPRRWIMPLAAALALAVISSAVTWRATTNQAAPGERLAALMQDGTTVDGAPEPALAGLRHELLASLQVNLGRLPPDSQQVVIDNLHEIRNSLAAIRAALTTEPDSFSLQQLLYTTYERELSILADLNRMAVSLPTGVQT